MGRAEYSPLTAKQAVPKCHGVTQPISLAGPCDADVQRNKELEKVLIDNLRLFFVHDPKLGWLILFFCLSCNSFWLILACTKAKRNLPRERRFFAG